MSEAIILYRVTEVATQNGSALMPNPLWEGHLAGDNGFEVVVEAVNAPTFELPHTGASSRVIMQVLGGIGLFAYTVFMLSLPLIKKK